MATLNTGNSILSNAITVDSSYRVGIGGTPSAWSGFSTLQVSSLGLWSTTANNSHFSSNLYYNGTDRLYITSDYATEYSQQTGVHKWYLAGSGTAGGTVSLTQAMTLNTTGDLLINDVPANDYAKLQVNATSGTAFAMTNTSAAAADIGNIMYFWGTTGYNSMASIGSFWNGSTNTDAYLQFKTRGSGVNNERMRITSAGNVGIGTSSPDFPLTIASASSTASLKILGRSDGGSSIIFSNQANTTNYSQIDAGASYFFISTLNSSPIGFYTNNTERMRITSSGNTLIGTTTENTSVSKLQVQSDAGAQAISAIGRSSDGISQYLFMGSNNSTIYGYMQGSSTGGGRLTIVAGGSNGVYLAAGGTSWTSNSDERLKDINAEIENATDKLLTLRAVNFSWKSDETKKENLGLIAQDVQKVFPQVVNSNKEKDAEIEYLGVSYSDLVPVLVKAIQEQQAQIEELNTKIDQQQQTINSLINR